MSALLSDLIWTRGGEVQRCTSLPIRASAEVVEAHDFPIAYPNAENEGDVDA